MKMWLFGLGGLFVVGCGSLVLMFAVMFSSSPAPTAQAGCTSLVATADGSPTILGPSTLTADQIAAWWVKARGPGTPIGVDPLTLASYYIAAGNLEGIRGDIAFAQAVEETGYFASPDATQRNNFAGIAHPDGASAGAGFPSVQAGVIAQFQVLKEVVTGNNAGPFGTGPKIGPNWGGRTAQTWKMLGNQGGNDRGYWASARDYWDQISKVYASMGGNPVAAPGAIQVGINTPTPTTPGSTPAPAGCVGAAPAGLPAATGSLGPMWSFAYAQLGKPYLWGGAGPNSWDCSGLTQAAYGQVGVQISHNAQIQFAETHGVVGFPQAQLQPGDLVFFGTATNIHNVGIAVDTTRMLNAPATGSVVQVEPFFSDYYGASRPAAMIPIKA
jgi:cell wall-associated NlpC family hydrolase